MPEVIKANFSFFFFQGFDVSSNLI